MAKKSLKNIFPELCPSLKKEQAPPPGLYGDPTFGGTGNYGRGGYRQLAHLGLNPATQAMVDQEQEEIPKNANDQAWVLGKDNMGRTIAEPHWDGRNGAIETVAEQHPADNSVSRMRDLPGFPKMNTLVNPKGFVPANDIPRNTADPMTGKKAEYLGPTVNGVSLIPDGKREDNKEIDKMLGGLAPPEEDGHEPHEAEDMILHAFIEEIVAETLTRPKVTYPSRQGWNNKQINSLVWHKNQMQPSEDTPEMWHRLFTEPPPQDPADRPVDNNPNADQESPKQQRTPAWGFGAIGFPQQFVPPDYEQANPDYDAIIKDPIGSRRLTMPQDSQAPRQGVNNSIRENTTTIKHKKR